VDGRAEVGGRGVRLPPALAVDDDDENGDEEEEDDDDSGDGISARALTLGDGSADPIAGNTAFEVEVEFEFEAPVDGLRRC
jgi:hypothetical protein